MRTWVGLALLAAFGCKNVEMAVDGGPGALDGGDAGTAAVLCAADRECSDDVFCNGLERCVPGAAAADARGCVAPSDGPCLEGQSCDESSAACLTACDSDPDADGDGHDSEGCGGDDCDDSNGAVHPGAEDLCNLLNEDCVAATLGTDGDGDGDGFTSAECCNPVDGELVCGTDCDDTRSDIRPGIADACGNGDEDCDGSVDEDPTRTVYPDVDSDGYGVADGAVAACFTPDGYAALDGDCDDTRSFVHPGAFEVCNAADDDCNGVIDDPALGCECIDGERRPCGATDTGDCAFGVQTCLGGRWGACDGEITLRSEVCGGGDEDCDGMVDEADALGGSTFYEDADGDGYGNFYSPTRACAMPVGYVVDGTDCADSHADVHPGATAFRSEPACSGGVTPVLAPCPGEPIVTPNTCYYCSGALALPLAYDANCDGGAGTPSGPPFIDPCTLSMGCSGGYWAVHYGPEMCGRIVAYRTCSSSGFECSTSTIGRRLPCR